ncbi:tetratricopeptide repeat protein, partial [Rhodococcus sp. NPDC006774]|uniref:tetratricopeptide repeat protein n=1 Tax=Rhodococcus sp. NPDC006774 TaxID=3157186 RepID=UPI0033E65F63
MTPQPVTWWHNPAPGALDTLITRLDAVKNDPARPDVVVLDDARYNGVTPDTGLTAPRIRKIASLTTSVVLIVHSADLASWKDHATGGRQASALETMMGIGASPVLVNLLEVNAVDVAAELDDTELAAASQMLTDNDSSDLQGLDLTRFAEAMATVGKLHAAVQAAYEHGGMRAALVDAAIDATITDPAGADIDWLQTLTQIHYRRLARNARWKPAQFDTEFDDWATTGFSPGSPHAVLIRTDPHTPDSGGGERYRLLDALVPRLRTADRDLTHLDPTTLPVPRRLRILRISAFLIAHRRYDTAATWLLPAAHRGAHDAAFYLGVIAYRLGPEAIVEGHTATEWWLIAHDRGDAVAAFHLGLAASGLGPEAIVEGHTATQWWLIAHERGHIDAAFYLGVIASGLGPEAIVGGHTATEWWLIAHEHGDAVAALNLGVIASGLGPEAIVGGHTATEWWLIAHERGDAVAAFNLGNAARELGPEAVVGGHIGTEWWAIAAERSVAGAAFNLGLASRELGPEAIVGGHTATEWWAIAAERGVAGAAFNLGLASRELGPDAIVEGRTATQWWLIAHERGHAGAAFNLGNASRELGPEAIVGGHTATEWWAIAAERGHAGAAFNLGLTARELGP